MSFNNGYTAVTGATYTAAQYNTYTRDNLTAIWVYTTAGDLAYATGATALTRLGIGASGYILGSNGSVPGWMANTKYFVVPVNGDIALTIGDEQGWFSIPPLLNLWNITFVRAFCDSGSSGSSTIFQLRNITDAVDVLSTKATIAAAGVNSGSTAVIDLTKDDVATNDRFAVDVDGVAANVLHSCLLIGLDKP